MANEIFNRVRSAGKDYLGSVSGDYNTIKNTLGSKFGSLGNLSNTFDQRVADGLTDLLTGATGIKTSSIPEISSDVLTARSNNRKARQEVLSEAWGQRVGTENDPINSTKLQYPHNFISEDGSGAGGSFTGYSVVHGSRPDIADVRGKSTTATAKQTMTNYIHFRSLKRRQVEIGGEDEHYDIFLYVPNTLSDAINVAYSEAEKDLTAGAVDSIFNITGDRGGFFGGMRNRMADWQEIQTILKSGAPGSNFIKAAAGKTVNPLKFQLFQGVNMRSYTYNFEFRPMSDTESETIRHIVYAFRKSMLPGTQGQESRIYTFPTEWAIRFQGPIKKWVDYPMTTICSNATVNWAPNGFVHMVDGAPATVTLSLTFTEVVQLDRKRFDARSSAQYAAAKGEDLRESTQVGSIADIKAMETEGLATKATSDAAADGGN